MSRSHQRKLLLLSFLRQTKFRLEALSSISSKQLFWYQQIFITNHIYNDAFMWFIKRIFLYKLVSANSEWKIINIPRSSRSKKIRSTVTGAGFIERILAFQEAQRHLIHHHLLRERVLSVSGLLSSSD